MYHTYQQYVNLSQIFWDFFLKSDNDCIRWTVFRASSSKTNKKNGVVWRGAICTVTQVHIPRYLISWRRDYFQLHLCRSPHKQLDATSDVKESISFPVWLLERRLRLGPGLDDPSLHNGRPPGWIILIKKPHFTKDWAHLHDICGAGPFSRCKADYRATSLQQLEGRDIWRARWLITKWANAALMFWRHKVVSAASLSNQPI